MSVALTSGGTFPVTNFPERGAECRNFHLHLSSSPSSSPVRKEKPFLDVRLQEPGAAKTQLGDSSTGRERPRFFGFQPPNAHRGRSRPLLWRVQCAPVVSLTFAIGNLYKIPAEFLSQKSLCIVGAF